MAELMLDPNRERQRFGDVVIRAGVPLPDPRTTDAVLSLAALGQWLERNGHAVRGSVLDLGCGRAPYRAWLSRRAASVVAVDVGLWPGVDVVADAHHLPFRDRCFDTVFCTELLEHVSDPRRVSEEVARVLSPGGHALVTVPFVYPLHESPYDFQRFTHFGLRNMLEEAGLEVEALNAQGGPLLLVTQLTLLLAGRGLRPGAPRGPITRFTSFAQSVFVRAQGTLYRSTNHAAGLFSLGYMAVARKPSSE
jgi:SAM-dependent methyltransferase